MGWPKRKRDLVGMHLKSVGPYAHMNRYDRTHDEEPMVGEVYEVKAVGPGWFWVEPVIPGYPTPIQCKAYAGKPVKGFEVATDEEIKKAEASTKER